MTSPSGSGNNASRAPGYDLHPGQVVLNTWEVLEPLGRGGMGAVYRVYHRFMQKEMAMKTLRSDQVTDVTWKRFQIEAQAIAKLTHPNIVQIFDMGTSEEGQPFYTMELLEGQGLDEWIYSQSLTVTQGIYIFRQVTSALAFAHERGIIHRDIKPANIVLVFSQENKPPVVKVVDFGIAKLGMENQGLTQEGEVCGSPLYMAPEQAQGLKVDARSDIYSLGCAFFETLTGLPPFKGKNAFQTMMMHLEKAPPTIESLRSDLEFPEGLSQVVQMMLAKNPDERYANAFQIGQDLLLIERGLGAKVIARLTAAQKSRREAAEIEEEPNSKEEIIPSERTPEVVPEQPSLEGEEAFRDSGDFAAEPVAKSWKWPGMLLLGAGGLIALLLIGVTVAATAVGAAFFLQKRASLAGINEEISARRRERLSFLFARRQYYYIAPNDAKSYSEIGMIFDEGRRYYHFSSREDECIGEIGEFTRNGASLGWRPAMGVVAVGESAKIAFRPSRYLLAHPQLWEKFRHEDLRAIIFPRQEKASKNLYDSEDDNVHGEVEREKPEGVKHLVLDRQNIEKLALFTSLEALDFGDVELYSESASSLVESLNKLVNLRYLLFSEYSNISSSTVMSLNCVRSHALLCLWLPPLEKTESLIACLGKSKSIQNLKIPSWDFSLKDIENIAKMTQLRELALLNGSLAKGAILKLSALSKLHTLSLVGTSCPVEEADAFLNLKPLKLLCLSLNVWGDDGKSLGTLGKRLKANGVTLRLYSIPVYRISTGRNGAFHVSGF